MKDLIEFIARTLAGEPGQVEVTESSGQIVLRLAQDDVGRLIGRGGRTAKAMRTLIESGGTRYRLDIDAHGADEAAAE